MAKYTLGALIALVIIGVTGFYIVAKLNEGNAESIVAQPITILVTDPGPTQQTFDFQTGRPTEIRIDNRTRYIRILTFDGAEVEQLSNLKQPPPGGASPPRLYLAALPGETGSASVRFTKPGTYEMHLGVDDHDLGFTLTAVVK